MARARGTPEPDPWEKFTARWPLVRSVVLFFVGVGGVIYEASRHGAERPIQMGGYLAMLGLNIVITGRGKNDGGTGG